MRFKLGIAITVCVIGLGACSSGGSKPSGAAASQSYETFPQDSFPPGETFQADLTSAAPVGPSSIVNHYDTATCADWAVTDTADRQIVVLYYANKFNDPQPTSDVDSLISIITKTCKAYGADETPSHIAKVSIATVYGGN